MASTSEIEAAMAQVDRLNTIVGQLLGFGTPDVSNHSWQPLLPLAERSVSMVQDKACAKRVQVRVIANGSEDAQASVDGLQLEQVLTNLLLNGIEASPEAGEVSHPYRTGAGCRRTGRDRFGIWHSGEHTGPRVRCILHDAG